MIFFERPRPSANLFPTFFDVWRPYDSPGSRDLRDSVGHSFQKGTLHNETVLSIAYHGDSSRK
jgi:hypothetical protein